MKTKNNKRAKPVSKQAIQPKQRTLTRAEKTKQMVIAGILTAMVVVLSFIPLKFATFSVTFTLIPIVLGAALCGKGVAAWLGLVFGIMVLVSGDAAPFMGYNIGGTVITVLAKGVFAGFASATAYQVLEKKNKYLAVMVAAVVCPAVNTGIFLLGCFMFFWPLISSWAGGGSAIKYMIVGLVGFNFVLELLLNVVISPAIVRLLNIRKKA